MGGLILGHPIAQRGLCGSQWGGRRESMGGLVLGNPQLRWVSVSHSMGRCGGVSPGEPPAQMGVSVSQGLGGDLGGGGGGLVLGHPIEQRGLCGSQGGGRPVGVGGGHRGAPTALRGLSTGGSAALGIGGLPSCFFFGGGE